jgi:hypothetical protein
VFNKAGAAPMALMRPTAAICAALPPLVLAVDGSTTGEAASRRREGKQRLLDETLSPWEERHPRRAIGRARARGHGGLTATLLGSVSQALLR